MNTLTWTSKDESYEVTYDENGICEVKLWFELIESYVFILIDIKRHESLKALEAQLLENIASVRSCESEVDAFDTWRDSQ